MHARVALVTGAGRGIGRAVALALAARGARVMGVARTRSELDTLAAEAPVEILAESVATAEGCAHIVNETTRRLGPVEILVCNAGFGTAEEKPVWELDPRLWEQSRAVNLDAPFHLVRLAAPGMIERHWGRVIMVASTAAEVGGAGMAAYCATKAGLLGLTRAAAQDLGRCGVTCNAVLPGWVRTEMAERSAEKEASVRGTSVEAVWTDRAATYPAGRVVRPDEIAETIAFLAGETSSGINGASITVALGSSW